MNWRCRQAADTFAHLLYRPAALGRRAGRNQPWHRLHLIPGRLLDWVCAHYDRAAGMT